MTPLIKEAAQGLAHLLFPQLCAACTRPLLYEEAILCTGCNLNLPRTGYDATAENEAAVRFAGRLPFLYATAFCHFTTDGMLQHLLHRLKYKGDKGMGGYLGEQLGYSLREENWMADVDVIVPVPLHPKKEALRGYNQSALIAAGLAKTCGKALDTTSLIRARATESQTKKTREERVANVQDAFAIKNVAPLEGRHILLLDDVLTTGATLEAAARAVLGIAGTRISLAAIGLAAS